MRETLPLLFAVSLCLALHAKDEVDPFVPANTPDESRKIEDVHRWDDQVVKPDAPDRPAYISIGGTFNRALNSVDIVFKVDAKRLADAVAHPDLNRGVVLIVGPPDSPNLYTWLRPFQIAGNEAIFVVTASRKQFETMHLAFIPREDKRRFLYSLEEIARNIVESEGRKPDK